MKLDKNHFVLLYEDKPKGNKSKFNGFWCAFAFKREVFEECISFMEQSTLKLSKPKINIEQTKIFKSKAIEVDGFVDLGTWGEIGKLISKS